MSVTANELPDVPFAGLRIAVSEQGTTSTIVLEGEWDLAGQQAARDAVSDALRRKPECLVLDLSRLAFIDSSGVHIAMEIARRAVAQGFRLVIVPAPKPAQRIFEICGLTDLLSSTTSA